ncbi:hypothetical protein LWI28_010101 [Acer negundo]|uniref:Uncharacterized protein n=1 Tax=Acer negundo TaxID=4023 RepID=A0AAD5JFH0_ACENE|nr:hypothetical protein LWI28_010101 [Acer negundo]
MNTLPAIKQLEPERKRNRRRKRRLLREIEARGEKSKLEESDELERRRRLVSDSDEPNFVKLKEPPRRVCLDKVLVLIPFGYQIPNKISVEEGGSEFSIMVEEDRFPVTMSWLEGFLWLSTVDLMDGGDVFPVMEKSDLLVEKKEGDFLSSDRF